jgi:hypothetical protein
LSKDGGLGGWDQWLIGEDIIKVIVELDKEAFKDDSKDGDSGVVAIIMNIVEGTVLMLLEEIKISEEGISGKVDLHSFQNNERSVLM